MKDRFNRNINYLRMSITDRCDLRCIYCMPKEGVFLKRHEDILNEDEMVNAAKVAAKLGINKIRITGGEPLVRKNIISLCKRISSIDGIDDLSITTNAIRLKGLAKDLKEAGVNRLNISLDTLNKDKYKYITRVGNIEDALDGIKEALSLNFEKIKINVVLISNFNDDEIEDFANLTMKYPIDVRFIELMPMIDNELKNAYISNRIVLDKLINLEELSFEGVSKMYRIPGSLGRIGLISPVSDAFCNNCNRIRLTADGKLKPCLHSNIEYSIKGLSLDDMRDKFIETINSKPECHDALDDNNMSKAGRTMNEIGG